MSSERTTSGEPGAVPQIYRAITNVMADIATDGVAKNRKNEQQHYTFRGIDDLYNALCSIMAKHSLCIFPAVEERSMVERSTKSGGLAFTVTLSVTYTFVCALDGSSHSVHVFGEAFDTGDKATNKAMAAAEKYALLQVFLIPTEGDNDADKTTPDEIDARMKVDHGTAQFGTREAQRAVAERKLAEAAKQPKPPPPNYEMLQAFGVIKKRVGDKEYYRILGSHGYEKSSHIPNESVGRTIYMDLAEAAKAISDANEEGQ